MGKCVVVAFNGELANCCVQRFFFLVMVIQKMLHVFGSWGFCANMGKIGFNQVENHA
jgi:hypothetical protein